jgi:hypothetical protein
VTPTEINDLLVEAGISGAARPALLAVAHMLTGGNPAFRWTGTDKTQGDVAGMFQVMSKYHGVVPDIAVNQALQAIEIYDAIVDRGQLHRVPAEEVTADSLARTVSVWRMPDSHDKPKSETEHGRWLPAAKKLLADNPALFGRANDPVKVTAIKTWVPIILSCVTAIAVLFAVIARRKG